jgi:hypothetical protein
LQDKSSKSVLSPDQSRRPPRHDEGWQAANRKGRAVMTRKTYCGNLLWQSSLILLVPNDDFSEGDAATAEIPFSGETPPAFFKAKIEERNP